MNIVLEKEEIKKVIDTIEDMDLLLAIKHLLNYANHKKETVEPMSLDAFYQKIDKAENDIATGQILTHEELLKEVNLWKTK